MEESGNHQVEFKYGASDLLNYIAIAAALQRELKRFLREERILRAHLTVRGVQDHMEFILITGEQRLEVPEELQQLILQERSAYFKTNGRIWYHYHASAGISVTEEEYHVSRTMDCDTEPMPFDLPVPWDKAVMEECLFPQEFEALPPWLQRRLIASAS